MVRNQKLNTIKKKLFHPFYFRKLDKKIAEKIFIINPHLVDIKPELDLPINLSKEKYICCLFCKSEPIIGTLTVKKGKNKNIF